MSRLIPGLRSEPVRNTCPLIDRVIEDIERVRNEMQNMADSIYEHSNMQVVESLINWQSRLNVDSKLEELRSANSALRDWGNDLLNEYDELEEEVEKGGEA